MGAVRSPIVYVKKDLAWEYKRIRWDLKEGPMPDEHQLNSLGADGWELTTSIKIETIVYFYFRRPKG